jgi:hypothetical protein
MRSVRRAPRDDRGVAALVAATALVVLLTFMALGLDLGRGYHLRTRLHQTVEMAAQSGAGAYDREALDVDGVQRLDADAAEQRAGVVLNANLPQGAEVEEWEIVVLDDGQGGGGVDPFTGQTYETPTVVVRARASIAPVFAPARLAPSGDRIRVNVHAAASLKFRFEQ